MGVCADCPLNEVEECGNRCEERKCEGAGEEKCHPDSCRRGCFCRDRFLRDNTTGRCVLPELCGEKPVFLLVLFIPRSDLTSLAGALKHPELNKVLPIHVHFCAASSESQLIPRGSRKWFTDWKGRS